MINVDKNVNIMKTVPLCSQMTSRFKLLRGTSPDHTCFSDPRFIWSLKSRKE